MACKKMQNIDFGNAPENLDKVPFFDLKLDPDQKKFRDAIWDKEKLVVFADAAAGTGKTTIAVMSAYLLVKYGRYDGIVYIAAPVQEKKQGYLPGDIDAKGAPYFEPFMQAALKAGINPYTDINQASLNNQKNGSGFIDCVTHTYLRGLTFENKVILVDESQNYYNDELRKTLTRVSDSCKLIVIGHSGQIDLYHNPERSGFIRYIEHFKDDPRTAVCKLTKNYRGWISQHADSIQF